MIAYWNSYIIAGLQIKHKLQLCMSQMAPASSTNSCCYVRFLKPPNILLYCNCWSINTNVISVALCDPKFCPTVISYCLFAHSVQPFTH